MIFQVFIWCWNLWWLLDSLRLHKPHATGNALAVTASACVLLVLQVLVLARLEELERETQWRRACMREAELERMRLRKAAQELWRLNA